VEIYRGVCWIAFLFFAGHSLQAQDTNSYGLFIVKDGQYFRQSTAKNPHLAFVELPADIPHLLLDIRYARTDNFMGRVMYEEARAFLRKPVYDKLKQAATAFETMGYGILVFDAYRPYTTTLLMWNHTKEKAYVAHPKTGSRHNRGAAVDLTLYRISDGQTLDMGTPYDAFIPAAAPQYGQLPTEILNHRRILFEVMGRYGFSPHPEEWWHFDHIDYEKYPITDLSFKQIK
jgi:D-alanyl-D-alanine dipeptidase